VRGINPDALQTQSAEVLNVGGLNWFELV